MMNRLVLRLTLARLFVVNRYLRWRVARASARLTREGR
jgi:hypothetical protein